MTSGQPGPGPDLSGLPAEVLAEAIEGARADAVAELRARIRRWLVQSAELSLQGAGANGPASPPSADPVVGSAAGSVADSVEGPVPAPARDPGSRAAGSRPPGEKHRADAVPVGHGGAGGRGWYVYGLTWDRVAQQLPPSSGVAGAAVEVIPVGRLAVVGSWVDQDGGPWGVDESGEADLTRLEPLVRAHEGVLEALLDRGAVLPMRFGRLYPDPGPVRDLVSRKAETVTAALERLDGRAEWGLTLDWDPDRSGRPAPVPDSEEPHGAGYLARRRDQMAAAGQAGREARSQAALVHEALAAIADDQVVHQPRRQARGGRPVIWRASYLVGDGRIEAFRQAAADRLSEAPAELALGGQLTGPWPPYNFSALELDPVPA